MDGLGFLRVTFVGAAFEAGGHALLHFGVDAPGKCGIGVKFFDAAAQLEEIQHGFEKIFGGGAGWPGAEEIIGCAFCNFVGYINAGIGVFHAHAEQDWWAEVQALAGAISEGLHGSGVEQEPGFEFGAGERVFDSGGALGEAQALGLVGSCVEETAQAVAEVGCAADVGFGVRVGSEEGEDSGLCRDFGPGGVCRVELEGAGEHWFSSSLD